MSKIRVLTIFSLIFIFRVCDIAKAMNNVSDSALLYSVPYIGTTPKYTEKYVNDGSKQKLINMSILAAESYKDGNGEVPNGYTPITDENEIKKFIGTKLNSVLAFADDGTIYSRFSKTGFAAALYKGPDGEIILSFRGTELSSSQDIITDKEQILGGELPSQYKLASLLLDELISNTPGEIEVTGHSLGGAMTQYALATNDLEGRVTGYTFNSAGFSDDFLDKYLTAEGIKLTLPNLHNVRNDGDMVSFVGKHVGLVYDIDNDNISDHSIGGVIGYDAKGNAIYDGLIGNLQKDLYNQKNPKKQIGSSKDIIIRENPDSLYFFEVRDEAWNIFQESMSLLTKGSISPSMCCLSGDSYDSWREAEVKKRDFSKQIKEYLEGYGKTNPWMPIAKVSKIVGDGAAFAFSALEKKWFGTDFLTKGLNAINNSIEQGKIDTSALVPGDMLTPTDLKKLLETIPNLVKELETLQSTMKDIKNLDDAKNILQSILNIRSQVERASKTMAKLKIPGASDIHMLLSKTDDMADYMQFAIDLYDTGDSVSGYFSGIDNMRDLMSKMIKYNSEYKEYISTVNANIKCSCGTGCTCTCPNCNCGKDVEDNEESVSGSSSGVPPSEDSVSPEINTPSEQIKQPSLPITKPLMPLSPTQPTIPIFTPDDPLSGIYTPSAEGEDPWASIHKGILSSDTHDSVGGVSLNVIGMNSFVSLLNDVSNVSSILGEYDSGLGSVSDVAESIWGVVGGDNGIVDGISNVGQLVVDGMQGLFETYVSRVMNNVAGWVNATITSIVGSLTESINGYLDKLFDKIQKKNAPDVDEWIISMREYSECVDSAFQAPKFLTVVDAGTDGDVVIEGGSNNKAPRKSREGYKEDLK